MNIDFRFLQVRFARLLGQGLLVAALAAGRTVEAAPAVDPPVAVVAGFTNPGFLRAGTPTAMVFSAATDRVYASSFNVSVPPIVYFGPDSAQLDTGVIQPGNNEVTGVVSQQSICPPAAGGSALVVSTRINIDPSAVGEYSVGFSLDLLDTAGGADGNGSVLLRMFISNNCNPQGQCTPGISSFGTNGGNQSGVSTPFPAMLTATITYDPNANTVEGVVNGGGVVLYDTGPVPTPHVTVPMSVDVFDSATLAHDTAVDQVSRANATFSNLTSSLPAEGSYTVSATPFHYAGQDYADTLTGGRGIVTTFDKGFPAVTADNTVVTGVDGTTSPINVALLTVPNGGSALHVTLYGTFALADVEAAFANPAQNPFPVGTTLDAFLDNVFVAQGCGNNYLFTEATLLPPGAACAANGACGSGYCVNGVCCNTACGGGTPASCQACSVAAGGAVDGVCATITTQNLDAHGNCTGAVCAAAIQGDITVPTNARCILIGAACSGNVTASAGSSLTLLGASVHGNVQTNNSASLTISPGSAVNGNVQPQNTAAVSISTATIGGNVQPQGCGTFSLSGSIVTGNVQVQQDTGATNVTGDTVGGNLELQHDAGGVVCSGNHVHGNIQIQQNSGGVSVTGNTWGGNVQCQQNTPPATMPPSQCGG